VNWYRVPQRQGIDYDLIGSATAELYQSLGVISKLASVTLAQLLLS
jgi:hypothetical protein